MAQWTTGDIITAEKLNQGTVLIVDVVTEYDSNTGEPLNYVCNKTWQEMYDAGFVIFKMNDPPMEEVRSVTNEFRHVYSPLVYIGYDGEGTYGVGEYYSLSSYTCNSPDGYPTLSAHEEPQPK